MTAAATPQNLDPRVYQFLLENGWVPPNGETLANMNVPAQAQPQIQAPAQIPAPQAAPVQLQSQAYQQAAATLAPTPSLPAMQNPYGGLPTPNPQGFQVHQQAAQLTQANAPYLGYQIDGNASVEDLQKVALQLQNEVAQPYGINVQLAKPPINTLPVAEFLRREFIEGKVIERVAPELIFLDMANRFTTDSKDIVWFRHRFSPDTDTGLKEPQPLLL